MKLLLDIPDNKSAFVLELLKNLPFVKTKKVTEENLRSEEEFFEGLSNSIEQVKLAREGKIKLQSAREFLDEL